MRKQKAARPVLESMEHRLVLSVASALNPIAEIGTAVSDLVHAHHSAASTAHHSRSQDSKLHHHTTKATKATHPAHPVHHQSSTSSSSGSSLSNFFKSVFPGL